MKFVALLVLSTAPAMAQSTWYVDVHSAGPGDGSPGAPFSSIQAAIDAPTTGPTDTVLVRPGVYFEQIHLDYPTRVHVKSTEGPTSTVIRSGLPGSVVTSSSHATLEGFTILKTGGGVAGIAIHLFDLSLVRCIVVGRPNQVGIFFDSGVVDHCIVANCHRPIWITTYSSGSITNSILTENNTEFTVDTSSYVGGVLVEHCVVNELHGIGSSTNIAASPEFVDVAARDFHLRPGSPCIDAGDPSQPFDPDGSITDIGPLRFDSNYAPFVSYCTAKVNSLGCTPAVGASGAASASAPLPFEIVCTNELNQRSGLLFYGFAPNNITFQGGHLCVHAPVQRTPLISSGGSPSGDDCTGVYTYDFNARIQSGADPLLEPGRELFAQFWSRDPSASFSSNRSDALRFRILP